MGRPKLTQLQIKTIILGRIEFGTGCWRWKGTHRKSDGRPTYMRRYAYALVYEMFIGPIPEGCILHHWCDNPWCVQPWHLRPIPQGDHLREHGLPGDWGQAKKTHCPANHPYDDVNTYWWHGERQCRICMKASKVRYRARRRLLADRKLPT